MRRAGVVVLLLFASLALVTGCASTVRLGGPDHSCAPGFFPENELGSISAQQFGPGYGIQWGVYPKQVAATYVVDVYMNNRRVDHKQQSYPPHGSVNARDVVSGGVFRLEGSATNGAGDVAYFFLTCKAA